MTPSSSYRKHQVFHRVLYSCLFRVWIYPSQ